MGGKRLLAPCCRQIPPRRPPSGEACVLEGVGSRADKPEDQGGSRARAIGDCGHARGASRPERMTRFCRIAPPLHWPPRFYRGAVISWDGSAVRCRAPSSPRLGSYLEGGLASYVPGAHSRVSPLVAFVTAQRVLRCLSFLPLLALRADVAVERSPDSVVRSGHLRFVPCPMCNLMNLGLGCRRT